MCVRERESLLNLGQQSQDDSLIAHHKSMTGITEVHPSCRNRSAERSLRMRLIGRFSLSGRKATFERRRGTNLSGVYLQQTSCFFMGSWRWNETSEGWCRYEAVAKIQDGR